MDFRIRIISSYNSECPTRKNYFCLVVNTYYNGRNWTYRDPCYSSQKKQQTSDDTLISEQYF